MVFSKNKELGGILTKKWMILITILMLAAVLVSGCADNADDTAMEEETVEETTVTEETVDDAVTATEGKDYAVRMEYYGAMKPAELELNKGDTIAWRNYKPQGTYTLVSDDGLFEDQEMDSNDAYSYTFTESGTFTFSVVDTPDMILTVTVN
jgi:plastocyanin